MLKESKSTKCGMAVLMAIVAVFCGASLIGCGGTIEQESRVISGDKVDIEIAYGDYGAMDGFAYTMYDGMYDGQIVHIDGEASNTETHNILVYDEATGLGLGVGYVVEGWEDKDYPDTGTRIELTGEVRAVDADTGERSLVVYPENFSVIEG